MAIKFGVRKRAYASSIYIVVALACIGDYPNPNMGYTFSTPFTM
jgi:hypothetical protein